MLGIGCAAREGAVEKFILSSNFAYSRAPFSGPWTHSLFPDTGLPLADAGYRNEWKFKSAKPKQVLQTRGPGPEPGQSGEHSFRERKQQTTSAMFAAGWPQAGRRGS